LPRNFAETPRSAREISWDNHFLSSGNFGKTCEKSIASARHDFMKNSAWMLRYRYLAQRVPTAREQGEKDTWALLSGGHGNQLRNDRREQEEVICILGTESHKP
jgi:hypothetical protein